MRINDFTLGEIANDFRHYFTNILSDKASENKWSSTISVLTNEEQNAFYFSHRSNDLVDTIAKDIQDTLESMKRLGYEFDVITTKKGYSIEVTNIKHK